MPTRNRHFFPYRGDRFPTIQRIMQAHEVVLEESEGAEGVINPGVIDSAAHKPVSSVGGADAYPTFFGKVAAIGHTIAHDHGFRDGNKRTALFVMLDTLEQNGYYPDPSEDNAVLVMVLVAMGLLSIDGLRIALMIWCGIDPADQDA